MRLDLYSLLFHFASMNCLIDFPFTPDPQFYKYPRHNRFFPGEPGEIKE
jgi:hypothetical protein